MNKIPLISLILIFQCSFFNIQAINLKASYDAKHDRVDVNWTKDSKAIRQFVLQRSTDQLGWSDIAFQKVTDFNNNQFFQFFDNKPIKGKYYYRLKILDEKQLLTFSTVVIIKVEPYTFDWNIYPIPVGEEFTVQYKGTAPLLGVVNIQIQDMHGKTLTSLRFASTTNIMQIRTNNLFKGLYVLNIIVEDEKIWTRQFVK